MANVKKLKVNGEFVLPVTVLDAVKDATTGSVTYGKSVRQIIEDNEEVTSKALTELDSRVGKLADLNTTEKSNVVAAINELQAAAGVTEVGGATGAITLKAASTTNGDVNLAMSGNELQASVVGLGDAAYQKFNNGTLSTAATDSVASEKSVADAIATAKSAVVGTSTTQASGTTETLTSIDERVDTLESALNIAGTDQATIDKIDEVLTWFSGVEESDPQGAAVITAAAAVGTKGSGDKASTGLIKDVEDLQAVGATKVEASTTNGNIKINGTETTVYTHPTTTAVTAAAVKVGNDELGHVVLGDALVAGDITAPAIADATDSVAVAEGTVASQLASLAKSVKAAEHTKTTVVASSTNGNILVDGAEVTVYTAPAETQVTVATDSANYLGASNHEISAKTSDIASGATGLATAAAVYAYAVTAEASSDTTDYDDVF